MASVRRDWNGITDTGVTAEYPLFLSVIDRNSFIHIKWTPNDVE